MGATSSAQRGGKCEGNAEEPSAGQQQVQGDNDEDKLLQKNGQISTLNERTENQTDDLNGCFEEKALVDVGSGFVSLKEDDTETSEDLKASEAYDANTENVFMDVDNENVKMECQGDNKLDDVEVGFKRFFRFLGFRFTLKKDKCEKNDAEEPITSERDKKDAVQSADSMDNVVESTESTNEQSTEELHKESTQDDKGVESRGDLTSVTDNEMEIVQMSEITEHNEEITTDKRLVEEFTRNPVEPISPFKRFFTQGIFASIGKRRKEEVTPKEEKRKEDAEILDGAAQDDSMCICLNVSNIMPYEDKNVQVSERDEAKLAADEELINYQEPSPLKRLFRKLSTRRQRETKPAETNVADSGENLSEKPQSSRELIQNEDEEIKVEELRSAVEEHTMDISPEESKRKSDSNVSWEALICGGSSKKRSRKASDSEEDTQDTEEPRKTTESPLVSSNEGDYDHLTSSSDQAGSPTEGESGSKWKSLKKLVTPKRKARVEESGSPEQIPSDNEITKDESSCSIKKLLPGRKKRKSDEYQEHTSTDEASKANETDNEDDETPAVVPLSEYELTEPERLMENERTAECPTEKEMQPLVQEVEIKLSKPLMKHLSHSGPSTIPPDFSEELTEFISKHQQLSDIPEEGIVDESVVTPESSADLEWATQADTLAEDIIELTADAVTAPELPEDFEDETTEMVSAVSQLTESPEISENVSPVLAKKSMSETDVIFQEAVESICMSPNILCITTKDRDAEALAVSVSPCILETTISTEPKVLVVHEKAEATSFCTGLVCQEIEAVEKVIQLPFFERVCETSEAVQTEMVSEDWEDESEAAGITTDDVYEAEVREAKIELQDAVLLHDNNIPCTESKIKTEQLIPKQADLMDEDAKDVLSQVTHIEEVKECSVEVLNNIQGIKPVYMALQEESCLPGEQVITVETNMPETEASLETTSEDPVLEQQAHSTEVLFEGEKEHSLPDVEISGADVEQVALDERAVSEEHNIIVSLSDSNIHGAAEITNTVVYTTITEVSETETPDLVSTMADTAMKEAPETELITEVHASVVECPEVTETISVDSTVSDVILEEAAKLEEEIQMENIPLLPVLDSHKIRVEVRDATLEISKENTESAPEFATAGVEADVSDKVEEIREEIATQQKVDPIPTEESCEFIAEETVDNTEEEKPSETGEYPFEETEKNQVSPQVTMTDDESRADEQQEDVSKALVTFEKLEIDITPVDDHKIKQSTDYETYIATHKEEVEITSVTSEQPSLQKEFTEDAERPLTIPDTNSDEPSNLQKETELKADEFTIDVVPESAITGGDTETSTDTEGVISDVPELKEEPAAKPDLNIEITAEPQESTQALTQAPKTEQVDTEHLQTEMASSKTEQCLVTESSPQLYEVEDSVKVTEIVSEVSVQHVEEPKQITIVSSDQKSDETESEAKKSAVTETEGNEFKVSEQPILTVHGSDAASGEVALTTVEAICTTVHKEKAEDSLDNTQQPEALVTSLTDVYDETKISIAAEIVQQKDEITVGSEQTTGAPDVTEQEIATEFQVEEPEISEKDTAALDKKELKEESTMNTAEVEAEVLAKKTADASEAVENETESVPLTTPEIQTEIAHEPKAKTVEMTEPSIETPVVRDVIMKTAEVSELEVKQPVVTSVVTELEVETPVVTSATKNNDTVAPAVTLVIKNTEEQSVLTSDRELIETARTTLKEVPTQEETQAMVPETQTDVVVPEVIPNESETCDANYTATIPPGAEVTQSKIEIPVPPDRIEAAAAVTEKEAQTPVVTPATKTEGFMGTCVEKNLEPKTTIITPIKDKTELGSSTFTSLTSDSQPISVEISATTKEVQAPTISTIKISTDVPQVQEQELPLVTETPAAIDVSTQGTDTTLITETKVQTTAFAQLDVKTPVTSVVTDINAKVSTVKSEVEPMVAQVAETLTVMSAISVPPVVPIPVVVPMVHTPTAQEAERSPAATNVQESYVDAETETSTDTEGVISDNVPELKEEPAAKPDLNIEITAEPQESTQALTQAPKTEQVDTEHLQTEMASSKTEQCLVTESSPQLYEVEDSVKVTEIVSEVSVQHVEEPKQITVVGSDQKSETEAATNVQESYVDAPDATETKDKSIPIVKTTEPLPEVEDDVWEDAVDDIKDECPITQSAEFQDAATLHLHT